ncbi:bis(5'-nucleosyl)-tetraphosphatase (symmetrical) YqeK [Virgibacillus byunsanensis]|uniref:bis(5'-nucleosyl)-tetraphosphatase (symmetrical) n=1 Tax=Virgibacillus byunsanensis TaxID=570945 RepID=A0ABW3LL50_9BACI
MNKDEAILLVKPHLTKERFDHTLRVATTAEELAGKYNESKEKVELAAIFHDYAKYRPKEELRRRIIKSSLPKDLLHYHHELWHGPVGALLIEQEYGITDRLIQSAIRYHTTGKANMSKLDMIIFIADYMEPGRTFPGVDEVREIAQDDLIHACLMASRNTIQHLMNKNASVYPDTFYTYNDLINRINGGN